MTINIERRKFVTLLGGVTVAWPFTTSAQQPTMPVVGYLHSASPAPFAHLVAAFRQALNESSYAEGRNVAIEYRWADGQYDRLPELASDLVKRQVAVIVTAGGGVSALAAKKASSIIPIVFSSGDDPVKIGLVESLSHPGGNVTGVNLVIGALDSKKLGLLRELVPNAHFYRRIGEPQASGRSGPLEQCADGGTQRRAANRSLLRQRRKGSGHDVRACGAIRC